MKRPNFNLTTYCENSFVLGEMHSAMLTLSASGYDHIVTAIRANEAELTIYSVRAEEEKSVKRQALQLLGEGWEYTKNLLEYRPEPIFYVCFTRKISRQK